MTIEQRFKELREENERLREKILELEFNARVKVGPKAGIGWVASCSDPFFFAVSYSEEDVTDWAKQEFKRLYKGGE